MNRTKRVIRLFLALLTAASLCLSACASGEKETAEEEQQDSDEITIGMVFDSFVIERWERDRDVFVSTARDMGADVNVQNANGSVEEQIACIDYLIDKGVDALVIISIDGNALSDSVAKAKNKGIKVIAYDRMINNSDVDLYVSFDNEMVGTLMAQALVDAGLPNGKVVMLQGSPTDDNVGQVRTGFEAVMAENNISIIASMCADGWRAEDAADYLDENLGLLDEADGIMCGNDNIASSVIRVLSENRKAGKIAMVGQDADLEACQRIVEGTQVMTVYKPVEKEAEAAAKAAIALIKGEEPDNLVSISDGTYDISGIILEPVAVTSDNIDETIIESGFHLKEEVYLNVKGHESE